MQTLGKKILTAGNFPNVHMNVGVIHTLVIDRGCHFLPWSSPGQEGGVIKISQGWG